jgi:site-specific recombinase XerD
VTHQELQRHLTRYLDLRHAFGNPLASNEKWLSRFVDYVGTSCRGSAQPVTAQLVFDWVDATMAPESTTWNRSRHLSVIRQFLEYLSAAAPETQVPELRLLAGYKRRLPLIFTPEEIARILSEAARRKPGDFCSVVFHTALGLIASTGLRAAEALGLDRNDVMPRDRPGTLFIRRSKFGKSRIVPVHPSVAQQLSVYADQRESLGYGARTPAFFVSRQGGRLSYKSLSETLHEITTSLGIAPRNGSRAPTLHSFRHTFVVTRLRRWHDEGVDVRTRLAHLSTYLGHVDFRETFWYVTATPELLVGATSGFAAPHSAGGE